MMNDDDMDLNNIDQNIELSMQNFCGNHAQNDQSCYQLLEILEMEDDSNNAYNKNDGNIKDERMYKTEKLNTLNRSAPPLATVAPIRNESIVCSSSSAISNGTNNLLTNYGGGKPAVEIPSNLSKSHTNIRSHSNTPPSRPLSASCMQVKMESSGGMRKDLEEQQPPHQLSYAQPTVMQQMVLQNIAQQYGSPLPYQSPLFGNNNVLCIVADHSLQSQTTASLTPSHGLMTNPVSQSQTTPYQFVLPQNLLLSMQNSVANTTSVSAVTNVTANSSQESVVAARSVINFPSSNLPKILPKPQNQTSLRQLQYISAPVPATITQFKRPNTKKNNSKPRASQKSTKVSKATNLVKEASSQDSVLMAWDLANSYQNQLESDQDDVQLLHGNATDLTDSRLFDDGFDGFSLLDMGSYVQPRILSYGTTVCSHSFTIDSPPLQQLSTVMFQRASVIILPSLENVVSSKTVLTSKPIVVSRQCVQLDPYWVGNSRMVQLLCAHLGRHNSNSLPPILKYLLPPENMQTDTLSVCTEHEDLNEDDLFSDISPVKRDPAQLAHLDRLLESCQPRSSDCLSSGCGSPPPVVMEPVFDYNSMQRLLPFQMLASTDHSDQQQLQLQDFLSAASIAAWLRKSKHKAKWMDCGMPVKYSRTLEVPGTVFERKEKIIRKKSTYKEVNSITNSCSKSCLSVKISKPSHQSRKKKKYREKLDQIRDVNYNNNRISLATELSYQQTTETICNNCDSTARKESTGSLKMRIRLPQLEIVESTVVVKSTTKEVVPVIATAAPRRLRQKPQAHAATPSLVVQGQKKQDAKIVAREPSPKRIFCTRKEDRRSSAKVLSSSEVVKPQQTRRVRQPRSPSKNKKVSSVSNVSVAAGVENPPLILKLCPKRVDESPINKCESPQLHLNHPLSKSTTGSIKLRLKRTQEAITETIVDSGVVLKNSDNEDDEEDDNPFDYRQTTVTLVPPTQPRQRSQHAVLQFSPDQSSSDSDAGIAHNEISSLLQRQEQREPLESSSIGADQQTGGCSFSQLPVPYLVGTDPTVFMDPHEVDLVVVKNARYKKVCNMANAVGISDSRGMTVALDVVSDNGISGGEMFVPGCYVDQEKSWHQQHQHSHHQQHHNNQNQHHHNHQQHHSSPSMPVLAPQEPYSGPIDVSKSASAAVFGYGGGGGGGGGQSSNQNNNSQQQQPYSDPSDRIQQSPLCMTAAASGAASQSSQYASQSPFCQQEQQPNYHYPSNTAATAYSYNNSQSASNQMHPSPVCSSTQLSDYSYFQQQSSSCDHPSSFSIAAAAVSSNNNNNYQQSTSSESSQQLPKPPTNKNKRSSSRSQSNNCDQGGSSSSSSNKKQRKDNNSSLTSSSSLPLPMYSSSAAADLYSATASQYNGLDYYNHNFSNFLNMDQMKLYEQYASLSNFQWGAMAEYCKALNPQPASVGSAIGLQNSNPLSLTSNLHTSDYSYNYSAYAMSQPYMHSGFTNLK